LFSPKKNIALRGSFNLQCALGSFGARFDFAAHETLLKTAHRALKVFNFYFGHNKHTKEDT
jgi:hypothetical protein